MIAIITVIYKNYVILEDFLQSLDHQNNQNFKIYISDLTENPQAIKISNLKLKDKICVIHMENLGYAQGINRSIEKAMSEGIDKYAVVNPDTILDIKFVDNAILDLKKNPGAILTGKIYYAPGYEYHKTANRDKGKVFWFAG